MEQLLLSSEHNSDTLFDKYVALEVEHFVFL